MSDPREADNHVGEKEVCFNDEDLRRLKERAEELDWSYNGISSRAILALLTRLQAAEQVCKKSSLVRDTAYLHDDLREWRKAAGK